jgi:Uma2 family endonuclease
MNDPFPATLTYGEFLAFVADKDEVYEFVDGRAVALASPGNKHSRIATVLISWIYQHLDGTGCDTHGSKDVWTGTNARRPDVAVTCDQRDTNDESHPLRFPKLVIEIVSPNKGDDEKTKHDEYEGMPTIEEYVLVDSARHRVRVYRRGNDGRFRLDFDQIAGTVYLPSISYMLDIDAMYAKARA